MRVTAERREATRSRLLEAAANEFGRVGLERANIDSISVGAGYAKGTIYNYFASKEELFLAVVEEASMQATAAAVASRAGAPARERLRAILAGFCDWAATHDALARVLVRECLFGTPALHARVIDAEAPLTDALTAALTEGALRRQVRSDLPPEQLALAIAGLTDLALAQHWASGGTEPRVEEIPELVLHVVLDGTPRRKLATRSRDLYS